MQNALITSDLQSHLHPQTNPRQLAEMGPLIIERGDGVTVSDTAGKTYIEGMSSLWCAALGFDNERLADVASQQMRELATYHTFNRRSNPRAIALAERLAGIAPMPDARISFANSGSEAVDTMIKFAWLYQAGRGKPEKRKIISRHKAYHGNTVMGAALSGIEAVRGAFASPNAEVVFASAPDFRRDARPGETELQFVDRLIDELAELIRAQGAENLAAMIMEPVMGAGGVIIPPEGYCPRVEHLLRDHDILVLSDEVICGFGRTGHWFGCQSFGFQPDMVSAAKAISSGYLPIGATILSGPVYEGIAEEASRLGVLGHGFTYAGHPVTSAVALETLQIYQEMDLLGRVRSLSLPFGRLIASLANHQVVEASRHVGLLGAVELRGHGDGATGRRFLDLALSEGLIIRALGDTIAICPPLIITESELEELFGRFHRALDALDRH
ncbi:aminotransferase [Bosea sp. WAO]|uniref:aminotransferase n=1 Tax=Bosea sp. WAO TaxID=406341 RepID=UPI0007481F9A|nr:aminotransferase [Bosea sp. WAO]KUL96473.1 aminotransferase [Bosea sp. WAO]